MASLSYESLGSISGVTNNKKVPASSRSRDRNDRQRMSFNGNSNLPFTGIIHVQATVGAPTSTDNVWFDIAEMQIDSEGGAWSYEPQGEFSSIRVVCKAGNFWAAIKGTTPFTTLTATPVSLGDQFTIATVQMANEVIPIGASTITLAGAETLTAIATLINTAATTSVAMGGKHFVADVFTGSGGEVLRIYAPCGTNITVANLTGTPLTDIGFTTLTGTSGQISTISMLR
jgi:hypothetical protein